MKIFESTIEFLAFLGITSDDSPFNLRALSTLLTFCIMVTLISSYLFFEAETFEAYTESIYLTSLICAIFVTYIILIWNKDNAFQFIDYWEKIAETSKYLSCRYMLKKRNLFWQHECTMKLHTEFFFGKFIDLERNIEYIISGSKNAASTAIYVNIIDKVERLSRFIHIILLKVTVPCSIVPKFIVCFYLYFTTDKGNDAFELPFPIW